MMKATPQTTITSPISKIDGGFGLSEGVVFLAADLVESTQIRALFKVRIPFFEEGRQRGCPVAPDPVTGVFASSSRIKRGARTVQGDWRIIWN